MASPQGKLVGCVYIGNLSGTSANYGTYYGTSANSG